MTPKRRKDSGLQTHAQNPTVRAQAVLVAKLGTAVLCPYERCALRIRRFSMVRNRAMPSEWRHAEWYPNEECVWHASVRQACSIQPK